MQQNTSHAVMSQRVEPDDSVDDFPTPPWATRALGERLQRLTMGQFAIQNVWDPAAGRRTMVRPLQEYAGSVHGSDIVDYGAGVEVANFLTTREVGHHWIITNPPFNLAEKFVRHALDQASVGVAVLVRMPFLETAGRYTRLYHKHRPAFVLQFVERVPMLRGRLLRTASTATAYCWVVWTGEPQFTQFEWIEPCRKRLERFGDYDDDIAVDAAPALLDGLTESAVV